MRAYYSCVICFHVAIFSDVTDVNKPEPPSIFTQKSLDKAILNAPRDEQIIAAEDRKLSAAKGKKGKSLDTRDTKRRRISSDS